MTRKRYNPPDQIADEHDELDRALMDLSRDLRPDQLQDDAENGVRFMVEAIRGVIRKLTAFVGGDGDARPYEGKYQRGERAWLDVVVLRDADILDAKRRIKTALEACLAARSQEDNIQAAAK